MMITLLTTVLVSSLLSASPKPVPAETLGAASYEVRYTLAGITTKVADATITLENSTRDNQAVLHSHAAIKASSIFKLFMQPEYISDAYMDTKGEEPIYSINPIKKGKKEGKFECIYDKKGGTVEVEFDHPLEKTVKLSLPYDGRTMDLLSLIQFVRFHEMSAGESVSMHLLAAGKAIASTLTCQGVDTERFPGIKTIRYHITMIERGLMENGSGNEISVWVSDTPDRQILGLETALSSGVMSVSIKK